MPVDPDVAHGVGYGLAFVFVLWVLFSGGNQPPRRRRNAA
jgi:hypothetical protein